MVIVFGLDTNWNNNSFAIGDDVCTVYLFSYVELMIDPWTQVKKSSSHYTLQMFQLIRS